MPLLVGFTAKGPGLGVNFPELLSVLLCLSLPHCKMDYILQGVFVRIT